LAKTEVKEKRHWGKGGDALHAQARKDKKQNGLKKAKDAGKGGKKMPRKRRAPRREERSGAEAGGKITK